MSEETDWADFVQKKRTDADALMATVQGKEATPWIQGLARMGVPLSSASCHSEEALEDLLSYRNAVGDSFGGGWMDNTTLLTAIRLLEPGNERFMTPLTAWDLATFARAVVCLEFVHHHEHPDVDDQEVNGHLGEGFLRRVWLPRREPAPHSPLPDPWEGAHRFLCEIQADALAWLRNLHQSATDPSSFDAKQLEVVRDAWRTALGDEDLHALQLVDHQLVDHRWTSPSNRMLEEIADATRLEDVPRVLEPDAQARELAAAQRGFGLHDPVPQQRSRMLSELNLRAYINQRLAEFFELPYVSSLARVPFRQTLYDRALRVQQQLQSADVIDDRRARTTDQVHLSLPVFLAVALRDCKKPSDLWKRFVELRELGRPFRKRRTELDQALARGDLSEAGRLAKALETSLENVLAVAGKATARTGLAVVEQFAKGDVTSVGVGVAALQAIHKEMLSPSLMEQLEWRLRRPELVFVSRLGEESKRMTEALPALAAIWNLPVNRQKPFVARYERMKALIIGPGAR